MFERFRLWRIKQDLQLAISLGNVLSTALINSAYNFILRFLVWLLMNAND